MWWATIPLVLSTKPLILSPIALVLSSNHLVLSSTLSHATHIWLVEAWQEGDISILLRHWFIDEHDTIFIYHATRCSLLHHATWCILLHLALIHLSNMILMHVLY